MNLISIRSALGRDKNPGKGKERDKNPQAKPEAKKERREALLSV